MKRLHGRILAGLGAGLLGVMSLAGSGCATSIKNDETGGTGGTGAGGSPGTTGTGGSPCQPEAEICDHLDNDCNGEIDDVADLPGGCVCDAGDSQECYSGAEGTDGVGECKKGTQDCVDGSWGECQGQVTPQEESCNLKDDDCDGAIDQGLGQITCGSGACAVTVEACVDGAPQQCVPGQPSLEVCDGVDNNCNQLTDETDPQVGLNCATGSAGICAKGKFQCNAGTLECVGATPVMEVCDGIDNDCDGVADNNILGTGGGCSTGAAGVCDAGMISCQLSGGAYSVDCFPIVAASAEVCDGLDNDCDGAVDDGDPGGGTACNTGSPGICAPGVLHCLSGAVQCVPDQQVQNETCNGLDDNCNGAADEGNPGGGVACPTGVPGLCATGVTSCTNGAIACNQTVFAQTETCNGLDDNCNGLADEGNPGGGAACNTALLGACAAGTITCVSGGLQCVQNVQPSSEICGNAIDENCDGSAPAAPTTYFSETFANNNQGWTIGTEWGIGPAVASVCASTTTGNDPGTDHTPTADNGVAGVLIGGCYPTTLHADYCITSPNIDLSSAAGNVYLSYWRHLHTDYPSFISSHVDASSNGGSTWSTVYSVASGQFQNDAAWTQASFNVTPQKSATFRVRFCYSAGSSGIITGGGWSVDDVTLTDVICQ